MSPNPTKPRRGATIIAHDVSRGNKKRDENDPKPLRGDRNHPRETNLVRFLCRPLRGSEEFGLSPPTHDSRRGLIMCRRFAAQRRVRGHGLGISILVATRINWQTWVQHARSLTNVLHQRGEPAFSIPRMRTHDTPHPHFRPRKRLMQNVVTIAARIAPRINRDATIAIRQLAIGNQQLEIGNRQSGASGTHPTLRPCAVSPAPNPAHPG